MRGERAGVLIDSGAWIAFFRARDAHHLEAEAMLRRALADRIPLVTTSLVIAEVHRFLLDRAGIRPASIALERISSSPHVRIVFPHDDHDREARQWLAKLDDQPITYTDAVSFAVMKAEKLAAAMTFDRDFTIAGFRAWVADL